MPNDPRSAPPGRGGGSDEGSEVPGSGTRAVDVAVVVVTWNSARHVEGLLATLEGAMSPGVRHHLVVADNGSADDSVARVHAADPAATVVELGRNAGYAAGINAAVAAAPPARAYLVLNPDVRLGPGCVDRLLEALRQPGAGIAVPRIEDPTGRRSDSLRRRPSLTRAWGEALVGGSRSGRWAALGEVVRAPAAYERPGSVDWASGCIMLIDAACAEAVGAWDESFFLYAEETDYCLRAADMGWSVRYVPEARAIHVGGESHESPHLWSIQVVNRHRLYRRRHGAVASTLFWLALVVGSAVRAAAGAPTHRAALVALLRPSRRPPEVRGGATEGRSQQLSGRW